MWGQLSSPIMEIRPWEGSPGSRRPLCHFGDWSVLGQRYAGLRGVWGKGAGVY